MNINEALNLLNLSGKVSKEDVRNAYKQATIKYHPDRNPNGIEIMKAVNAAYKFLSNLSQDFFFHSESDVAYNFAEELSEIIDRLKRLSGITIEVCGNWLWLSGDTKVHKEVLKELGCYWASKKCKWYYRPHEHKSSDHKAWDMDKIRSKYGSHFI